MKKNTTQQPRVLMFGWEFPPHNSGGLGVACYGITRGLSRLGVPVTFVLPKRVPIDNAPIDIEFASDGGDVDMYGIDTIVKPYVTQEGYTRIRSSYSSDASYGLNLYDEVRRYGERARLLARRLAGQFDVIHAHDWLSFKAGLAVKEETGKPLIVHVHATEYDRTGGNGINPLVYEIERQGVHGADFVVSVSDFTKQYLVNHYDVDPSKVVPVHNGIEASDYSPEKMMTDRIVRLKEHGHNIVLFVGRLTLQKGPDYFVEAAAKIIQHSPKTRFVVAGSGDMEASMVRSVARLGLSDAFIFAGFVRGPALSELYKKADLYIMPSVSEPFGITPLESLINGTPVIISKQSGVSEILKNALTVDFWDVDEIANKAVSVLNHDSFHTTLQKNGQQEVYQHTWTVAAEKLRAIYDMIWKQRNA